MTSYVSDRTFRIKHEDEYSDIKDIKAGVPQGSVFAPILYLLYTSDIPVLPEVTTAAFADDTALIATGKDPDISRTKIQQATSKLIKWTKRWKIKLNELKSIYINFTN